MKEYNAEELKEILKLHKMWLRNEAGGARADLRYANLSYANLSYADLSSADLRSADLCSADLRSANLRYANLCSADLRSADLRSANLCSADLRSADLRYANLSYANLDKKYVQVSCIGSRKGITTYCVDDNEILCGCWKGNLEEFIDRVHEVYPGGQFRKEYDSAIAFFKSFKEEK